MDFFFWILLLLATYLSAVKGRTHALKGSFIWRFIRALKDEQKPTDIVFGADNRGVSVHLKRKKSRINRLK